MAGMGVESVNDELRKAVRKRLEELDEAVDKKTIDKFQFSNQSTGTEAPSCISNDDNDEGLQDEFEVFQVVQSLPEDKAAALMGFLRGKERVIEDLRSRNHSLLDKCNKLDQENQITSERCAELTRRTELAETEATEAKSKMMKMEQGKEEIADYLFTLLGFIMIFHGAQFKNLFLCFQVVTAFCYSRVQNSVAALYNDLMTAKQKISEDAPTDDSKADAKAESKHAQKRAAKKEDGKPTQQQNEEDAAEAKKLLKVLDHDKVSAAVFEVCVTAMACHMVMEGGLARIVVVAHALVKASKEQISSLLEFGGHEDMQAWTDLFVSFVLYCFFGGMAVIMPSVAFALNLGVCGAQLLTQHGFRIAESMGKLPGGSTAEQFTHTLPALAALGGLTLFGCLWQFWALMADSGMAFYFTIIYLPAVIAEKIVGLF